MTNSASAQRQLLPSLSLCKKINIAGSCLILLITLCAMLSSCTEKEKPQEAMDAGEIYVHISPQEQEELGEDGRVVYLYLVLNSALGKGDTETAMASIQELLYLAPTEELFREAVSIYEFAERHQQALDTAITGAKLYPLDLTLHMMLAELTARSGRVDAAISQLKSFSSYYNENQTGLNRNQKQKDLRELRLLLIRLFMSDERFGEAETAIAALPAKEKTTATVLYYQAQIFKSTGRELEARAKLQELVERHPNFTEGWMALAAEAEQSGKYGEAAEYYRRALESNDLPQIFLLMLNAMLEDGQIKGAIRQIGRSDFPPEVKLQAASLFVERQLSAEAREVLLSIEDSPYIAEEVSFMLAMLAYDTGRNIPEALERLDYTTPDSPSRAQVLHLKALLQMKNNDLTLARETAENLRDEFPESRENWFFLAEVNNYDKKYQEAESVAREALEQWPDDPYLLYTLGTSLGFQGRYDEAVGTMEIILDKEPENAMVLNYIGYTLADQDRELPRALQMITRAHELEPDSFHIVDSLAWVYYRKGELDKAWTEIKRCISMGANDPIVWEHYGDIAAALGKNQEASEAYKKSLALGGDNSEAVVLKMNQLKGTK